MSDLKEFSGFYKEPSEEEILKLLSILNYVKNKFGVRYKDYVDGKEGPVKPSTHTNAESKKTMSAMAYAALTKKVHGKLTLRERSSDSFLRLNHVDHYMRPVIADLFSDIGEIWGLSQNTNKVPPPESLLAPYSVENSEALERLREKFKSGGHIYRYAKNSSLGEGHDPRLAVGRLTLSEYKSSSMLEFEVRYHVDSDNDLNDAYDSVITGRVMQINSFFVFIGVERDKGNPFFLVMKTALPKSRFKGLILRKHPKKSYFASRVMLASDVERSSYLCRKLPATKLPEVSLKQLELLTNIATNSGHGVLMLEDD